MSDAVLIACISAGIPAAVTLITAAIQAKGSKRRSAQQSILTWIMHDQLQYEQMGELPKHYEKIHAEYDIYHANGGNGIITEEVRQYDEWYKKIEKNIKK